MIRSSAVMSRRLRISADTHRNRQGDRFMAGSLRSERTRLERQQLDAAAGRLDLCPGRLADAVDFHGERNAYLALTEDDDRIAGGPQQSGLVQRLRSDLTLRRESCQPGQVDLVPGLPVNVGEAAFERKTSEEREVPALPVDLASRSGPGAFALRAAAGRLALSGGKAAAHAP